jgi:hypothetical protein
MSKRKSAAVLLTIAMLSLSAPVMAKPRAGEGPSLASRLSRIISSILRLGSLTDGASEITVPKP